MWSPLGKPDVFPYPQPGEHNNAREVLTVARQGRLCSTDYLQLSENKTNKTPKQTKEKQQPQNKSTQELKNPHLMKVNR